MRGLFSITICSAIFLLSCNYNIIKNPQALGGSNNSQTLPPNESANLGWDLIKNSALTTCMSCHVGHTSPELGSLGSVQQNLNKILTEVHSNSMPPAKNGYAPLSDCNKAILEVWIQQGAPPTSSTKVGDLPACKTTTGKPSEDNNTPLAEMPLTYQTLMTKILQPKCLKCHNPDSEDVDAAGILFFPFSEITKRNRLWAPPGRDSKIIKVLSRSDETRMPPPEDGAPLSAQEIEFITRWIDAGKP